MALQCKDVRSALISDEALPQGIEEHLSACSGCGALLESGGQVGRGLADLARDEQALEQEPLSFDGLRGQLDRTSLWDWLQSRPTLQRWLLVAGMGLLVMLAVGIGNRRPDFEMYPQARFWLVTGGLAVVALGLALTSLRGLHQTEVQASRLSLLLGVGVALPVVVALLPEPHAGHAASEAGVGLLFAKKAGACFASAIVTTLPWVFAGFVLSRDGLRFRRNALLLGVSAGVMANLSSHLYCPVTSLGHQIIAHVAAGLALALAIWWWRGRELLLATSSVRQGRLPPNDRSS